MFTHLIFKRAKKYRSLLLLVCCHLLYFQAPLWASPYQVVKLVHIENGDWYPLSKKEMEIAAVDTALSVLTQSGDFKLYEKSKDTLKFNLTLLGSAETIQLTITFNQQEVTYVSTASQSVKNLDYQGIYRSFQYVGRHAGEQLNSNLTLDKSLVTNQSNDLNPSILEILREVKRIGAVAVPGSHAQAFTSIFNEAQRLKRNQRYQQARSLFEALIQHSSDQDSDVVKKAKDELIFGIPMYELARLSLVSGLVKLQAFAARYEDIVYLTRELLANNVHDLQRTVMLNKKLDQANLTMISIHDTMLHALSMHIRELELELESWRMDHGVWPDQHSFKEMLARTQEVRIDLKDYRMNKKQGVLHVVLYAPEIDKMRVIEMGNIK
ncbi:MAG: hypothetical protein Q9N02_08510 [Ghiorsea sp.]|nr:hypothetical protein [Ghiorsea sp.]